MGRSQCLTVLGYFTLIVAPVPSVERVAKNAPSMGGGIGAHMPLQTLPWDSVVRFVGLKHPQF
jgi:hypothetical protein